MAWYNPLSWGRNDFQDDFGIKAAPSAFYCANPQCRREIRDTVMAYETGKQELVHSGDCEEILVAHRIMKSHSVEIANFRTIQRNTAETLARNGKISAVSLDNKIE